MPRPFIHPSPETSALAPVAGTPRHDLDPATLAVREWAAHVEAGRIGTPPPGAPTPPGDRLASLARLLSRTGAAR